MTDEEFDELWTSCAWRGEIDTLRQQVKELERTVELYQAITTGFEHERIAEIVATLPSPPANTEGEQG